MPCIYLTEEDVDRLLDMSMVIGVMEQAFRSFSANDSDNVRRRRAQAPRVVLHLMSAAADYLGLVGWKQYAITASGARFLVGLYEQQTGELISLIVVISDGLAPDRGRDRTCGKAAGR